MRNVVFISRHNPLSSGGGPFATRAYLEAVLDIYPKEVTFFTDVNFNKEKLVGELKEVIGVVPRTKMKALKGFFIKNDFSRYYSAIKDWTQSNKDIDLVIFDGGLVGGSYAHLFDKNVKKVTIHHNFELEYIVDNKSIKGVIGYFPKIIARVEKKSYASSNLNLFITKADLLKFKNFYGECEKAEVLGCFEYPKENNDVKIKDVKTEFPTILKGVISGSLNTKQSIKSIEFFIAKIYPQIKKAYPNFKLTIAGRNPGQLIKQLCEEAKIILIASPKDMKLVLKEQDIYLCPVKLGGGLKLRIMDALSLGLPCIIQEISYRGYEDFKETGMVLKYTDENDFLNNFDKIVNKISKEESSINTKISNKYKDIFSFVSGTNRLSTYLNIKL